MDRNAREVAEMGNMNCNGRSRMLRKVQQHGFAMIEAGLYLDGHPNCRKALDYFNRQRDNYMKCTHEFEEKYGPLTMFSDVNNDSLQWIQGPWPWESEAN